jgi:hypothetical protein
MDMHKDDKITLNRLAYAHLQRINAFSKAGTITLNQRPDLWLGRNVFLAERQKLAYIMGTQNTWTPKSHTTTLTLSYVHDPGVLIGNPWLYATNTDFAYDVTPVRKMLGGE